MSGVPIDKYQTNQEASKKLIADIGEELSLAQADNLVVMSTPMIATILLMHRRGISLDLLVKRVSWLFDEIKARKGEVGLTAAPSSAIVSQCLNFLSGFVNRNRDIF